MAILAIAVGAYHYHADAQFKSPTTSSEDDGMEIEHMSASEMIERPLVRDATYAKNETLFRDALKHAEPNLEVPDQVYETYYDLLSLDGLKAVLSEDPYCHTTAHGLGRVIYAKSGQNLSEALVSAGNFCGGGAFHGVLMAAFGALLGDTTERISPHDVAGIATSFCHRADVQGQGINYGVCIHGIGHALSFLVDNDVAHALELCDVFASEGERYYCASGAYMQRAGDMYLSDASSSTPYPCGLFDYPAGCYRYTLRHAFAKDRALMTAYCVSLPNGANRNGCFHGLGFTLFKEIEHEPTVLASLCASSDQSDSRMCVEGSVGLITGYRGRTYSEKNICDLQQDPWRTWCTEAARVGNFGMDRDFKRYYVRLDK